MIGWQQYEHVVCEYHHQGILQVAPAAADPSNCEIVKQHAGKGTRTVRWVVAAVAIRASDLPEVPSALLFANDAVLQEREINALNPIPYDKGKYLYCLWGTYTYAIIRARPVDGDFVIGNLPPSISNLGDAQAMFPAAKFRRFLDTGAMYPKPA